MSVFSHVILLCNSSDISDFLFDNDIIQTVWICFSEIQTEITAPKENYLTQWADIYKYISVYLYTLSWALQFFPLNEKNIFQKHISQILYQQVWSFLQHNELRFTCTQTSNIGYTNHHELILIIRQKTNHFKIQVKCISKLIIVQITYYAIKQSTNIGVHTESHIKTKWNSTEDNLENCLLFSNDVDTVMRKFFKI